MSAEESRRKAQYFLMLARQVSLADDRALLISMAAHWTEQADEIERIVRIQQQAQFKKQPKAEGSS